MDKVMKPFLCGLLLVLSLVLITSCRSTHSEKKNPLNASLTSYRTFVLETIHDTERSEALIAVGDDLHRTLTENFRTFRKLTAKLNRLNADYHTSREALERALADINAQRRLMRERIIEARVKAVELTTPEEWQLMTRRGKNLNDMFDKMPGVL